MKEAFGPNMIEAVVSVYEKDKPSSSLARHGKVSTKATAKSIRLVPEWILQAWQQCWVATPPKILALRSIVSSDDKHHSRHGIEKPTMDCPHFLSNWMMMMNEMKWRTKKKKSKPYPFLS
jgi:hypothetical protein